jgi:hypothetical protein
VRYLGKQTVRDDIEIILVALCAGKLDIDGSEVEGFNRVCVVEAEGARSTAEARAAGVRKAGAPIVAFLEDHSYPSPGWAEVLIRAHEQPWAAVGPSIVNANPNTIISWANILIEYGQWLDPVTTGAVEHLPGHNSSYKRNILLEYGSDLEDMLEAESVLHWDLQAKGHRLYLETEAHITHWNFSLLYPTMSLRFNNGRLFAASRSLCWSLSLRLLYTIGAPLIPVVRLWRILNDLRRQNRQRALIPKILPALVLGLVFEGAGEMTGYASGFGNAKKKLYDMEFHRSRHMTERDRKAYN